MATILVTDGTERSALAACRSLTRAGHEVHTASARHWSLAGVSRRVCEHVLAEDAMVRPDAFAAAVMALAARVHADVLLPMTDASATAILSQPAGAPVPCRVPLPPFPAFQLASDKAALLPLAERAGFAIPESTLISSRAGALTLSLDGLVPGVLKPQRSIVVVGAGLRRHGVVPFATAAEGATRLRSMPDEAFPILVQRRVDGPGVGFFALRWGGRIVATFAHRRVREVPPSGGVSVCRESIPLPPRLAAAGTRLLTELDWEGVAMVECKHDALNDRYYVIEINPRFWGSLQLAIDAGVDFPALLVECSLGRSPRPVTSYAVGIRSRWGWGEVDYVYLRTKLRPPGTVAVPAFLRALGEVLHWSLRRDRVEILRWRDPLPFVVETLGRIGLLP